MSAASLITLLFGAILGLSVGLVGIGSVVAVPLLIYGGGLSVHTAVCVSMLTMTLLGFAGTIQKFGSDAINLRAATVIAISGALFAPLGAWLNKQMTPGFLLVVFALIVLAISIRMLLQPEARAEPLAQAGDATRSRHAALRRSAAAGAAIGLLGGLLGVSGGFIAVPVLVTYQGLEMHCAVATAWTIVAVVSASATIGHFLAGQRVPLGNTVFFLIGSIIGFQIAIHIAHHFSGAALKRLFAAALLLMSFLILVRSLASAKISF